MDQRIYYRNYILHNTERNQSACPHTKSWKKKLLKLFLVHGDTISLCPSTPHSVRYICCHQIKKMWVPMFSVKISHLYPRKDAAAVHNTDWYIGSITAHKDAEYLHSQFPYS